VADHQLRQQRQEVIDRNRDERQQTQQQAASDRARLAAFYAAQRAREAQ
jgi:hypothetical protein